LIATLLYTFARVGAVVRLKVGNCYGRCSPFLGPKNSMLKVDRCLLKMGL